LTHPFAEQVIWIEIQIGQKATMNKARQAKKRTISADEKQRIAKAMAEAEGEQSAMYETLRRCYNGLRVDAVFFYATQSDFERGNNSGALLRVSGIENGIGDDTRRLIYAILLEHDAAILGFFTDPEGGFDEDAATSDVFSNPKMEIASLSDELVLSCWMPHSISLQIH
jgi:hypothetical protein